MRYFRKPVKILFAMSLILALSALFSCSEPTASAGSSQDTAKCNEVSSVPDSETEAKTDDDFSDKTETTAEKVSDTEEATLTNKKYRSAELDGLYKPIGRIQQLESGIALDWAGSGISFSAYCEGDIELTLTVSGNNDYLYLTAFVDGERCERMSVRGSGNVVVASGLSAGVHTVEIYRTCGAHFGQMFIRRIELSGEILGALPEKELFIEFIGDSISTGFGVLGNNSQQTDESRRAAYDDCTYSYPFIVAHNLDADWSQVAMAGVYLQNLGRSDTYSMKNMYDLTAWSRSREEKWGFERSADLVVINLGTNDTYGDPSLGYSAENFENDVEGFIKHVREKNPGAPIVWAYEAMTSKLSDEIKSAIETLKDEGYEDIYYFMLPMGKSGGDTHPNEAQHKIMARKLTLFIEKVLSGEADG